MENPYKRKKEPELVRQTILNAAIEIGATDWHHVTFQSIAEKTGVSKGGIIHHFSNKEELLDCIMKRSLIELTEWIIEEKKITGTENGSMAYLQVILKKNGDAHYKCTMRVIMQAILVNEKYVLLWEEWFAEHIIHGCRSEQNVNSLIINLVTDGLWYADNLGRNRISAHQKEQIAETLTRLSRDAKN
ncbi:TetR/AcrR family transcriptional regulator [Pedobacter frigidisoli]|uniref:TetR/AcrR family transcriptional regulator n=1 Tax=Pedobacter frigidisoli TaxID=2530455 RepID=A0A4V2MKG4_9SPHI|nr:TetR/AcrR family transcriptional regulator [Pedobacter frigidisoli]TCC98126.1 TetR/AcrR family transcriptional regulator [Pedobacter frigidisoli]